MHISKKEYDALLKQKSPNSPLAKNMSLAFLFGGAICMIGQAILNGWKAAGLEQTDAASATSITLIFIGALLTGLGLYDRLARHAGAGTIVPITGFSNAIVSPAMEFKSEGIVLGLGAKLFTVAGPVLVFGISTSILYGLVLYILGAA